MTVSTTTSTITYLGNGATTDFTFPFIGVAAADITVSLTDSVGTITVLNNTQYTLALNAASVGNLWGIGGTVTYPISGTPLATGNTISITRGLPYTQTISISNQGSFYPQAVEQALDKLELQIQQVETGVSYSIRAPESDASPLNDLPPAVLRENGYLAFDASGQPIITTAPSSGTGTATGSTARRVATTGTATINVLTSDAYAGVSIYQSSTPVTTVQLPTTLGPYPIFDGSLNSNLYPIKILPPAGKTINGLTVYYLTFAGQSAIFYNDNTSILVA